MSAGFGISILPQVAILSDHQVLGAKDRLPKIPNTELALMASSDASPATRRLAELITNFCQIDARRRVAA